MKKTKELLAYIDRNYLKGRYYLLRKAKNIQEYKRVLAMSKRPIFIGGCGRSGTTLLLSLLSSLPEVFAIPEETGAFCRLDYSEVKPEKSDILINRIYDKILNNSKSINKTRWCEKTPKNIHRIKEIQKYFNGKARFINIVRNGRDVITSKHPTKTEAYWVSPQRWINDVAAGYKYKNDPAVLTIRYEDLVEDFKTVMKKVCAFIDEPYTKALEQYPNSAEVQMNRAWFSGAEKVHSKSVNRWKDIEHREVINELLNNKQAIELLAFYGY
jgi:hypothetical protein